MMLTPERPTRPEPKIVTAEGWRPPFTASIYVFGLRGVFRTPELTDHGFESTISVTRQMFDRQQGIDTAEYVRTTLARNLYTIVKRMNGHVSPVRPPHYILRDDRWPEPRIIPLDWVWGYN